MIRPTCRDAHTLPQGHVERGLPNRVDALHRDAVVGQPSGASKLCLSCHDGVTALDSFAGATGTTLIGTIGTGAGDLTTDLSSSHPISFTYDDALATTDGSLHPPTTTSSGLVAQIDDHMSHDSGQHHL